MKRTYSDTVRTVSLVVVFLVCMAPGAVVWGGAVDYVPEAAGYTLVYELPIPVTADFRDTTPIPYSVDNSASVGVYDRIAYYLELKKPGEEMEYVYVSMDSFNNNANQIGLPHGTFNPVIHQQIVSNMNVVSNKAGVTNGTGITTGNIEMWPSNYGSGGTGLIPTGSSSVFDWNDGGASIAAGYGSFQVHNYGGGAGGSGEVLFGYNRWSASGTSDLGIGTNPTGNPDWTFAINADDYDVRNLQILVRVPEPGTLTLLALGGLAVLRRRRKQ